MTRLHRALASVALAIGILAGPLAGQAFAAPILPPGVNAPARATSAFICSNGSTPGYASAAAAASSYLPIDRWGSVAGGTLHTRLHASTIVNGFSNITQKVERNVIESKALVMGNSLWRAGTDLTSMASRFCFADQAGLAADQFAATLGHALESSGVVVALLVASLLIVFWRSARRSERPLRGLLRPMVVTGLIWAMVTGAQATTTSGGVVHFGTFSPGWIVTRAYDTIDQVASAPATAIATQSNKLLGKGNNTGSTSMLGQTSNPPPLSCGAYVNSLLSYYKDTYGSSPTSQFAASVPMALNAMWMQTGLRAYTDVQFGAQNPFGPYAYCRLLESQAGVPFTTQIAITSLSYGGKMNPQALAWTTAGDTNDTVDRSMVGWAACRPSGSSWTVASPWGQVKNPNSSSSITPRGICKKWWSSGNFTSRGTALDWTSSSSNIVSATTNYPTVGNFLLNFHGDANATAEATAVTYALASIIVFVVFAILSLAVMIAKIALLVLMMLAVPVMLIALVPSAGMSSRAMGVAKHALSLIVFSTGAQILLALIAILTGMIVSMSGAITGQGSFFDILLTSLAPIAAIVLLHHFFKKVLKAPSPFKPTSALAWGAAAGGVGAGVGEGIDKLIHRGGGRAMRTAGSQAIGRARAGFGAPRPHRVGGMTAPAPNGADAPSPNGRRPGGPPTSGSRGGSRGTGAGTGAPGAGGRAGAAAGAAGAAGATAAGAAAGAATGAAAGATVTGAADWWGDQSSPGGSAGPAAGGATRPRSTQPPPPGSDTAPPPPPLPPRARPNASGADAAAAASIVGAAGIDTALRDEAAARHASRFGARDYRWARAQAAGGRWGLAKEMARDRANAAWERAADRPVRTALKVAGAATLGVAALPFAGVAAPAAAAAYGAHKTLQFHRERKATAPTRARRNQQAYTAARAAGLAERPHPVDAAVYGASPAARRVAWDARARYDFWRLKRANTNPRPAPGPAPTGRTGARPVGGSRLG